MSDGSSRAGRDALGWLIIGVVALMIIGCCCVAVGFRLTDHEYWKGGP